MSAREVTDGLSRTAAVAEILIGTGALQTPGRVIFSTAPLTGPANLDAFASACAAITAQTTLGAPDLWSRGRPWIEGDLHATGYNHILAPNQNNCTNGTSVMSGAYSSASMHPSGIELLYADGHAEFISSSIAIEVWRALGSRDGGEAQ